MKNPIVSVRTSLRRVVKNRRGANLVEYMVLVGAVALVSLAAATKFKESVATQMGKEGTAVEAIPTQ
jgi:Flp pilus assembly pilin Flp